MKLYFMKRDALEILKSNLQYTYTKYFTEQTNDWLWDVCGGNPFVEFRDVPDFQLSDLNSDLGKGEIDLINCKIIFRNLMFLSESQASDERVWAGLAHSEFYDYMRRRWNYDKTKPINAKKSIGEIKTRFFFVGGTRGGFYRNSLSKCWWVGRNTFDKAAVNQFEKLDIIGSNDLSTKITDIFYSNTFSSNPVILSGIIKGMKYFKDEGINVATREHMRPTLQLLNAIGGSALLDCLDADEIADIFIDNILAIIQGDNQGIEYIESAESDYEDESENVADLDIEEDPNKLENTNDEYVALGDKVKAQESESGKVTHYKIDFIFHGDMPSLGKSMLGKTIGEKVEANGKEYTILEIVK